MLARFLFKSLGAAAVFTLIGVRLFADEPLEAVDVKQIEAEAAAYVAAFNAKDAAALSRHWSETGVYVRPADGVRLVGRKAIEEDFRLAFAERPDAVLSVKVDAIRFVTADVAIEEGIAAVASPGEPAARSGYAAVHVKRDGEWQIDSIRETDLPAEEAAAGDHLAELGWLIGDWIDDSKTAVVETSVTWTKNSTFLSYAFKVSAGEQNELEGTQVLGWDPVQKTIRSWMFDSDGGFGEGVWTRRGDRWEVKLRQVLADGRTASSTNIYAPRDEDSFTWQSINREIDGERLPDVAPVTVVRKQATRLSRRAAK
ncbi:MAG TPA: SgcJ/EcaC family oxidoreductase [Pirellulales bacterium]|nr:SgcJ/EcaC family oxidoreductase [Pirellulales bacterium]